jgi:hypothetical protein
VATVRIVVQSSLQPDRVLAAARDFSARRSEIFPAVQARYFEVHATGEHSADVTEGTRTGPMYNWERCDYDWSRPDTVVADVRDSNIYDPDGSWWELKATPNAGGSRVEMTWERNFKRSAKGRLLNIVFKRAGNRLFANYAREIVDNLDRVEPDPHTPIVA